MTTTGNECQIRGDWTVCPASSIFTFNGVKQTLIADLSCPLDSVDTSKFIQASQEGRCECAASLIATDAPSGTVPTPMACSCVACPLESEFSFAYDCDANIAGPCSSFNCFGECNGDFLFGLDAVTEAPTGAAPNPTAGPMEDTVGVVEAPPAAPTTNPRTITLEVEERAGRSRESRTKERKSGKKGKKEKKERKERGARKV